MRIACLLALALSLSACGCVVEPGDSVGARDYWDGCWAAARRENR